MLALIVVDLETNRLGGPSFVADVLPRTVRRVAQVRGVDGIVLVHPPGQDPAALVDIDVKTTEADLRDDHTPSIIAARKWALTAWRGGLGGATCYDELLPAAMHVKALKQHGDSSALVVGGDWALVDPDLCSGVAALHLSDPDSLQMTFCQAPPGLAGVAIGLDLLEQFAENNTGFGRLLAYNPQRPQPDPIGRDVCVQIDAAVRGSMRRYIYDVAASRALIDALPDADANTVCTTDIDLPAALPQQMTLELSAHRDAKGELVPQHHIDLQRDAMDADRAIELAGQLAKRDDALLTLGGLGDALRHPRWRDVVDAAHDAGVFGICIETDLLVERDVLDELLASPVDVISVRINADTAETYAALMMPGESHRFDQVLDNIEYLLRNRRLPGYPWIAPRLIKTAATLKDMETFFERWMTFCGQAVIEPAVTGLGLIPDRAPVDMSPPRRFACRQLPRRLTVHADGRVPRCDQDWLARGCAGNADEGLETLWQNMQPLRAAHAEGKWNELELCSGCREWHRP